MFASLLVMLASLAVNPAQAGVHVSVSVPGVQIVLNPWEPGYRPAPRPGYVWVDGYWAGRDWVPGYWQPTYARAGYAWVPGYWNGRSYVDGYWRSSARAGYVWVGGCYYGGRWYDGGWVVHSAYRPGVPVYAYHDAVRHERVEDYHEAVVAHAAAQDRHDTKMDHVVADNRHDAVVHHEAADDHGHGRPDTSHDTTHGGSTAAAPRDGESHGSSGHVQADPHARTRPQ